MGPDHPKLDAMIAMASMITPPPPMAEAAPRANDRRKSLPVSTPVANLAAPILAFVSFLALRHWFIWRIESRINCRSAFRCSSSPQRPAPAPPLPEDRRLRRIVCTAICLLRTGTSARLSEISMPLKPVIETATRFSCPTDPGRNFSGRDQILGSVYNLQSDDGNL